MAGFDEEYKKLNSAQKKAVDTLFGPVLVLAGPGTGKTQLLSMRVANLLKKTDADASNILCLTFTNKAAANMRERLFKLAGSEANKVTVKTFHGFAAEIMANYPDYFWSGAKLSTAPDAAQLETVQTILAELPLSNPLSMRFAGQYTAVADALKGLRLAKEAGLTPEKLKAIIQANLSYIDILEPELTEILDLPLNAKKLSQLELKINQLPEQGIDQAVAPLLSLSTVIKESFRQAVEADSPTGKTKNTGKWKSRWLQNHNSQKGMHDERRRNNWWLAFCDVYASYRQQLHLRGYYDYSDMLLEVIVQIEQNPDLKADIQERYQYVLIDEFQDSNAAQLRLAHLVADHHASDGQPNLMAVGDDDQSIFGFNGAELNNMLFFERSYKDYARISLKENYRSSQALLNIADKIIAQAEDRLVNRVDQLEKSLVAVNPPKTKGQIKHLSFNTREHQLSYIARDIKKRRLQNTSIAVLARGHESLRTLSAILINIEVPVRYEQQSDILQNSAVKQIILLAQAAHAISSGNKDLTNQTIAQIVRHPAWQLKPADLWRLATENFKNPDWLSSLTGSKNLRQKQIGEWLDWLASESTYQPLPVIFDNIIGLRAGIHLTSPLRQYFLSNYKLSNEYLLTLSAVRLLRQMVAEFSSQDTASLQDFLQFINVNQVNKKVITDESLFVSQAQAVELYTVHKAKGLEFDQVFIIDAVEDNWKPRVAGRKPPANLPLQPPGEEDDDYIRLLYVAATRAKHTLIASSYHFDAAGKEVLASPFISEVMPAEEVNQKEIVPQATVLEENLRWPRLGLNHEKTLLKDRLRDYRLSATHLLNFLDVANCGPQLFFEKHLLRLPEVGSAALSYGNAMHSALQLAQKLVNKNDFKIEKIHNWFDKSLKLEHLNVSDYQKYALHGKDTISKLFIEHEFILEKGGQTEQQIGEVRVGEAILSGFIDHIQQSASAALITDYKTGAPLTNFDTKDQTKAVKAWRHKNQLTFYSLLIQKSPRFSAIKNVETRMVYVESEAKKDLIRPYQPQASEINRLESLAQAVWKKIMNLDFTDISGYTPDIRGIEEFEKDLLNGD